VLDGSTAETRTPAHEYGHAVLAQTGLRLPTWLNEGFAELYSNVERGPSETQVVVGHFLPGRVLSLRRDGWINLTELVSADANSRIFTSAAFVESAYAESWLLAHMLTMDPQYAGRLPSLLSAVQCGGSEEALGQVYGKSMAQIEHDLRAYLEIGETNLRTLDVELPDVQFITANGEADLEARLAIAEMLANYRGRGEQAREVCRRLALDYPSRAGIEYSTAQLWTTGRGLGWCSINPALR
jgi:hypothetical protein